MRVLLRAMAADPSARVTTEKLLALVLRESIEASTGSWETFNSRSIQVLRALDAALATIRRM